jgi:uncharacterized protein YkwD
MYIYMIKLLQKIFIIGLISFSIFTFQNEIYDIYVKSKSQILSLIKNTNALNFENTQPKIDKSLNVNEIKQVQTSGLLKVLDGSGTSTNQKNKLSISGVIEETNQHRNENNSKPLSENQKLNTSAKIKLEDMFTNQYFEHESLSGLSVGDLTSNVDYEYIIVGENLALGNFKNNKSLVDAWMASEGHRANILKKSYTEIGVAVGYGTFNGQKTWLAVQHFGTPKDACPNVDTILASMINIDQETVDDMSQDLQLKLQRIESGAIYEGLTKNEQIRQYNILVNSYNQKITELKNNTIKYNEGVKIFNECIQAITQNETES